MLLMKLTPSVDAEQVRLLFDTIDANGNGKVEILEFFELCDFLFLRFRRDNVRESIFPVRVLEFFDMILLRSWTRACVRSRYFHYISLSLICIDALVLCAYGRGFFWDRFFWEIFAVVTVVDLIFLAFFVVELLLRLNSEGIFDYWKNSVMARFDGALIVLSASMQVTFLPLLLIFGKGPGDIVFIIYIVGTYARVLRLFKLLSVTKRYDVFSATFTEVLYPTFYFGTMLLVVFYVWAVVGMEIFAGEYDKLTTEQYPDREAMFNSFPQTMLTLFQLLTTSNWQDIMYAGMTAVNFPWVAVYFVIFECVAVMLILNLLIALILETLVVQSEAALMRKRADKAAKLAAAMEEEGQVLLDDTDGRGGGMEQQGSFETWTVTRKRRRWSREMAGDLGDFEMDELKEITENTGIDLVHEQSKQSQDMPVTKSEPVLPRTGGFVPAITVSTAPKSVTDSSTTHIIKTDTSMPMVVATMSRLQRSRSNTSNPTKQSSWNKAVSVLQQQQQQEKEKESEGRARAESSAAAVSNERNTGDRDRDLPLQSPKLSPKVRPPVPDKKSRGRQERSNTSLSQLGRSDRSITTSSETSPQISRLREELRERTESIASDDIERDVELENWSRVESKEMKEM